MSSLSRRLQATVGGTLAVLLVAGPVWFVSTHRQPPARHPAGALTVPAPPRLDLSKPPGRLAMDFSNLKPSGLVPPPLPREFRGAWIASVGNIDWPSKPELSVAEQQAELVALLDRAAALKLNAIILEVRPSCDALYSSKLDPWSQYLTGEMGKAPAPFYDPLEFAVTQAHRRGLELHAWFNPFRALTTARNAASAAPNHITRTHPEYVRRYGDLLWLDPGEPAARAYVLDVILDVVHRYDIDAVHLDDYFYPYLQKDKHGRPVPFPDDASWKKYADCGGNMARDDWRRENINEFVRELYGRIKTEKLWVKLGISPFGIWRPQKELNIAGLDAFSEIYADSRKWLESGWLDYISPQLYWSTDAPRQSYPVLLQWWTSANTMQRHLWPGIATDRICLQRPASDILGQIAFTRGKSAASGNIHWHLKSLVDNLGQVSDRLGSELYTDVAAVPACSWLGKEAMGKPDLTFASQRLNWEIKDPSFARQWAIQTKRGDRWSCEILPSSETSRLFEMGNLPEACAVTALDRNGNASPAALWESNRSALSTVAKQAAVNQLSLTP